MVSRMMLTGNFPSYKKKLSEDPSPLSQKTGNGLKWVLEPIRSETPAQYSRVHKKGGTYEFA